MFVVPLIERKRDGGALTPAEWRELIAAYTAGAVPDYQMSALLMAVLWRGLDRAELGALTDAMLTSGDRLSFDGWPVPRIDKHSTGGVGDKVSLVLAPLVAACGVAVPMMSGRGLGHTGGTLDKLEAIPGFAASIMSKKLAEGLNALVLDVKRGSGAFLPKLEQSLELAKTMIALGEDRGCPTVALLTAMDRPLGRACGNALETEEAIQTLLGEGAEDLLEVSYALGVEMLLLGGIDKTAAQARKRLQEALRSGRAAEKLQQVIEAQGGNPKVVEDPSVLPQAQAVEIYKAKETGVVARVEPRTIGRAIIALGGGRQKVEDTVDHSVGFVITVKPGDKVLAGEPIASVFARDAAGVEAGYEALTQAIVIADRLTERPLPLISHRVTKDGVEELKADGGKPKAEAKAR